jgi:hypothetical protein
LELLAQSRVEFADFVVARRGKNASARSSSARRRAIFRRSQLSFELFAQWLIARSAREMFDCSLRSRGSRFEAAAFLSHSQTKSVSVRSFVQDSGARSWTR